MVAVFSPGERLFREEILVRVSQRGVARNTAEANVTQAVRTKKIRVCDWVGKRCLYSVSE